MSAPSQSGFRGTNVAFTPKGGCPLKPNPVGAPFERSERSIHPQGWVPIETKRMVRRFCLLLIVVAFTPKGGCPLKRQSPTCSILSRAASSIHPQGWVPIETVRFAPFCAHQISPVAFTPKGGCPLKPVRGTPLSRRRSRSSIHPQGWVPIETLRSMHAPLRIAPVAFTPKGGCPLKPGVSCWGI